MDDEKLDIKVKTSDPETTVKITDSKKGSKDISKMTLSELRKLHEDIYPKFLNLRSKLNEIARLIEKKGG